MARKVNIEKAKEKMVKLNEKIEKAKAELEAMQAEYEKLEDVVQTAEATELVELMKASNLSIEELKQKLLG